MTEYESGGGASKKADSDHTNLTDLSPREPDYYGPKPGTICDGPALTRTELLRRRLVGTYQGEDPAELRQPITQQQRSKSSSPGRQPIHTNSPLPSPTTNHVPLSVRKTKAQLLRERALSNQPASLSTSPQPKSKHPKRSPSKSPSISPRRPLNANAGLHPSPRANHFDKRNKAPQNGHSPRAQPRSPVPQLKLSPRQPGNTHSKPKELESKLSPKRTVAGKRGTSSKAPAKASPRPENTKKAQEAGKAKKDDEESEENEEEKEKVLPTAPGPTNSTNLEENLVGAPVQHEAPTGSDSKKDDADDESLADEPMDTPKRKATLQLIQDDLRQIVEQHEKNLSSKDLLIEPVKDPLSESLKSAVAEIENATKDLPAEPKKTGMLAKALIEARDHPEVLTQALQAAPVISAAPSAADVVKKQPAFIPKQSSKLVTKMENCWRNS